MSRFYEYDNKKTAKGNNQKKAKIWGNLSPFYD